MKIHVPKAYDIGFCGGTNRKAYERRNAYLQKLLDVGLDVVIRNEILQEKSLFYNRCRIVLNISHPLGFNMRVFEAMATGSMLLTNRLPESSGMEETFTDGEHLVIYDDCEDLIEKARFYIDHSEERERIAEAGRREVLAHHTYDHRVQRILSMVLAKSLNPTDTFVQNMCTLEQSMPKLAQLIYAIRHSVRRSAVCVEEAESGVPTTLIPELDGSHAYLHSRSDPVFEAREFVSELGLARKRPVAVFGLGLGYHLIEIARKMSPNALLIVVEASPEIFFAALETTDLRSVLDRPNTLVYLGNKLPTEALRQIQSAQLVFHPQSVKIFPHHYSEFMPAQH